MGPDQLKQKSWQQQTKWRCFRVKRRSRTSRSSWPPRRSKLWCTVSGRRKNRRMPQQLSSSLSRTVSRRFLKPNRLVKNSLSFCTTASDPSAQRKTQSTVLKLANAWTLSTSCLQWISSLASFRRRKSNLCSSCVTWTTTVVWIPRRSSKCFSVSNVCLWENARRSKLSLKFCSII